MSNVKWSSFTDVGSPTTGDNLVGLRGGVNVRFDPPTVSSPSFNLYVSKNGNDANPGSFTRPFLTVTAALASTVATSATSTQPVNIIIADGTYTEATINLLPYVNIVGQGQGATYLAITTLDMSASYLSTNQAVCEIDNLSLTLAFNLRFSTGTGTGGYSIVNFNSVNMQGATFTNTTAPFLVLINTNDCVVNGTYLIQANIVSTLNYTIFNTQVAVNGGTSVFSGCTINYFTITGGGLITVFSTIQSASTLSGLTAVVSTDAVSWWPYTLLSGATSSQIILQTWSNAIKTNYVPSHFTQVNNSVEGAIAGIDNKLGTLTLDSWDIAGNTLSASGLLGSLNAHDVSLIYNNIAQMVMNGTTVDCNVPFNLPTSAYFQDGVQILNALPLSSDNIFIGNGSGGIFPTSMISSIGFGTGALSNQVATTATNLIAIGSHALLNYNTTTSETGVIVIGAGGGQNGVNGNNCVLIGDLVCSSISNLGQNNVVLGGHSIYVGSANNNTVIGASANSQSSDTILIGYGTTSNSSSTNSIAIGNSAGVTAANYIQLGNNSHTILNTAAIYQQGGFNVINTITGTSNTFLGISGNITTSGTGLNTAAGNSALPVISTGHDVCSFGYQSGLLLTTGSSSCFFGSGAGKANVSGVGLVAIGALTLQKNTASHSTACGTNALLNSTSGSNTSFGYQSLEILTTASANSAFGNSAGGNITTGHDNCCFGDGSLNTGLSPFTGNFNVAIGNNTLTNVVGTLLDNTAVGYNAGSLQTGYNQCTFLGSGADTNGNYTNAIAIGYGSFATASNQMQLGNSSLSSILANTSCQIGNTATPFLQIFSTIFTLSDGSGNNLQISAPSLSTYNIAMPPAQGTGALTNNGAGVLSWAAIAGGMAWVDQTTTPASMGVNSGYVSDTSGVLLTYTLPATAALGDIIEVVGKSSPGWTIHQNAGQSIALGATTSTVGVGGSVSSILPSDSLRMVCITANTEFRIVSAQGNLTIV